MLKTCAFEDGSYYDFNEDEPPTTLFFSHHTIIHPFGIDRVILRCCSCHIVWIPSQSALWYSFLEGIWVTNRADDVEATSWRTANGDFYARWSCPWRHIFTGLLILVIQNGWGGRKGVHQAELGTPSQISKIVCDSTGTWRIKCGHVGACHVSLFHWHAVCVMYHH